MKRMLKYCRGNKGVATILIAGVMSVFLLVFLVVGIDFAYIYYVRGELQNAADAAALAGAAALDVSNLSSPLQIDARHAAWEFACRNKAGGKNVYLIASGADCSSYPSDLNNSNDATGEIVIGKWDEATKTFDPAVTPVNAVKVVASRRAGSVGGPVDLLFGNMVGWPNMGVRREAIATFRVRLAPIAVNEYHGSSYPNSFFRRINVGTGGAPGGPGGTSTKWCNPGNTDPWCATHPDQGLELPLAGASAVSNTTPQDVASYISFDYRTNRYVYISSESWYQMPNLSAPYTAPVNPGTSDWAPYLDSYPYELPITVTEQYWPTYGIGAPTYLPATGGSVSPYATLAYLSGAAASRITIMQSNSRYAPGSDIIVLVFDGINQGSPGQQRVTIVGYAKVRITRYTANSVFGYALEPLRECTTSAACLAIVSSWDPYPHAGLVK